jgi:hypothetical protein
MSQPTFTEIQSLLEDIRSSVDLGPEEMPD